MRNKPQLSALASIVLLSLFVIPTTGQVLDHDHLGSFQWDNTHGGVDLQTYKGRIEVSVSILMFSETNSPSQGHVTKSITRSIPTEKMSVWVLLDNGSTLELTGRDPQLGNQPGEIMNAGSKTAYLLFSFKPADQQQPIAVVLKIEDQYDVFRIFPMEKLKK